ncbi:MAG: hypothetical protein HQM10_06005 [Candidatus Riflebacteria bacterium]|nr:hypothetical protein [Candidatus Riflebacteria bacterium]
MHKKVIFQVLCLSLLNNRFNSYYKPPKQNIAALSLTFFINFCFFMLSPSFADQPDERNLNTRRHHSASASASEISNFGKSEKSDYCVVLEFNSSEIASFSADDLDKFPRKTFECPEAGKSLCGSSLKGILSSAGIKEFKEVTISGFSKGRMFTAEITLKSEEIDENVILALSNRRTAKLASPKIPFKNWIIDVERISVK